MILHGLLGSSRNWQTVGAELASTHHVFSVDLRNHGGSPHADLNDYSAMEGDLAQWLDTQALPRAALLGHSMGGKLAMAFACHKPERVTQLVVVDIAPRDYRYDRFAEYFAAMAALDPATLSSRAEAEQRLGERIKDWGMLKFLATNLERDAQGKFSWRVNVTALQAELAEIAQNSLGPDERFAGPTLFVVGGKSTHVRPEDHAAIHEHFPQVRIETLPESGHNPHIEDRAAFVQVVQGFLVRAGKGA